MNDESILKVVQHIESDLISDRSKIDQLLVGQATIEAQIKALYERIPRLEDKQKDAISEVVQPVLDSVDTLNKSIKKKKVVSQRVIINPITEFFKKLKGGEKKNE